MSRKYKKCRDVPTAVLAGRLYELSAVISKGDNETINREFVMRIPAEPDYCADLVIKEASIRLKELERLLKERDGGAHDVDCKTNYGRGCNCGHGAVSRYLNNT